MRIGFRHSPCGTATVMAQQMQNDDGEFTFRQLNPKMTAAPWGSNNEATKESWENDKRFWALCCLPAFCIYLCSDEKDEVINHYTDGD